MEQQDEEELRAFERHRTQEFRTHLFVYATVITFLFLINLVTGFRTIWAIYPALGWGIAVAIHAWTTYQKEGDEIDEEFHKWRLKRQLSQKPYRKLSE